MNIFKPKYLVGGVIGTILLGIVSSALWDGIKPVSRFLYEKTLNISVLGIEKFKDGIYQDIAKGYHENVSLEIFVLINSIILSFVIVSLLMLSVRFLYTNGDEDTARKILKVIRWPRTLNKRLFFIFFLLYTVFFLTVFSLNLVKTNYINQAVTYYNQMILITKPHMSEDELQQLQSQFAQIENKSDYVEVVNNLRHITEENSLKEPEFNFIF
jgi:hypothetical protein